MRFMALPLLSDVPAADATAQARPALHPTALSCVQCQLLGRRKMTCSRADVCASLPLVLPIAPVLLLAWAATAAVFVYTCW